MMKMYLQCGHGMMAHCRELISTWGGGTAILSPRDSKNGQLESLATDVKALPKGRVLMDPQFYLPHADHEKLCAHDYWPDDYDSMTFLSGTGLKKLVAKLLKCNEDLGCKDFIAPGFFAGEVNDEWLQMQNAFIETAANISKSLEVRATIALSNGAIRDDEQIAELLEHSAEWPSKKYYIVCEHPAQKYIVDDPNWVTNLLDLCAGLKLQGSHVILGYCNQQMLIAAAAKVDAIASGTYMNVRSFTPDKFNDDDGDIKRKSIWYYCPHALNEYKAPSLDIAKKLGLLGALAPDKSVDGGYITRAFRGTVAPSTLLNEQIVFRHYLHAMRAQALVATKDTFDETCAHHESLLTEAEKNLITFSAKGIRGDLRDFQPAIDTNKQAIEVLKHTRGAVLRREWASL